MLATRFNPKAWVAKAELHLSHARHGHPHSVFAVRRKDTMVSGQIDSGFGYQGGQFGGICFPCVPTQPMGQNFDDEINNYETSKDNIKRLCIQQLHAPVR